MGCVRVSSKVSCVLAINYLCVCGGGGEGRSGIVLRVGQTTEEKKLHGIKSDTGHAFIGPFPSPFKASATTATHFALSSVLSIHPLLPENAPHAPIFSNERTNYKRKFLN